MKIIPKWFDDLNPHLKTVLIMAAIASLVTLCTLVPIVPKVGLGVVFFGYFYFLIYTLVNL